MINLTGYMIMLKNETVSYRNNGPSTSADSD